ncbi:sulfatase-like hydrolase/transferase [Myxococcota bacterium]|nr:sulfatase-like hydrolase/transferase [Myxococcota bacterium]
MSSSSHEFRSLRLALLLSAAVLTTSCATTVTESQRLDRRPPNIVLIIGDDHGYADFGFMGSDVIKTPHLDALAANGTLFPVGYTTASVCPPALRSILTGLYPDEWPPRLRRHGKKRPKHDIEYLSTLPRILSKHGYATFQGGKHWEGSFRQAGFSHGMTETPDPSTFTGQAGGRGLELVRSTVKPAFDFIDRHVDQPFFLWFAPQLPHTPHDAPEQFRAPYRAAGLHRTSVAYYANITRFDQGVGDLMAHLDAKGLLDDTLVVYAADNGWQHEVPPAGARPNPRGGGKGKASLHEMGFRTPIVFNWPGVVPAGVVNPALISTVDLYPTLLDYAQLPPPTDRSGIDLLPIIQAGEGSVRSEIVGTMTYLRADTGKPSDASTKLRRGGRFLRNERWHYLWYDTGQVELYDIVSDPAEHQNLSTSEPEVARNLRRTLQTELILRADPIHNRLQRSGASSNEQPAP